MDFKLTHYPNTGILAFFFIQGQNRWDYSVQRLKTREPLVPPKPKELERA